MLAVQVKITPAVGHGWRYRAPASRLFRERSIAHARPRRGACQQVHLVNPTTGKVLGEDSE
jgi:hypothetical protein